MVLALPPSPEEAQLWGRVMLGDDLYLVGLLAQDGSPETNDHDHVAQPLLFPVEHEIPPERAALRKGPERYEATGETNADILSH